MEVKFKQKYDKGDNVTGDAEDPGLPLTFFVGEEDHHRPKPKTESHLNYS